MKYEDGKLVLWDRKGKNKEILFDGVGFHTYIELQSITSPQKKTYECQGIKIKKILTKDGHFYGVSYVYDINPETARKMYDKYLDSKYYRLINKKRLLSIDSKNKAYNFECGIYNGDFDLIDDIDEDRTLQIKDMSFVTYLKENIGLNDTYLKVSKGKQIHKNKTGNNIISKISNYLYNSDVDIMLNDLNDYSNSLESLFEALYTKNIKHIPNLINSMNINNFQYEEYIRINK